MPPATSSPAAPRDGDVNSPSPSPRTAQPDELRSVVLSSFVGSAIEYYDFLLYTQQASLVFSSVFFSNTSGAIGMILSFSTLAVGYLIRPLGGIVFGHFGDRLGRKRMLIITISLMGGASFLIGCVPSYAAIGAAAPIALVLLRLVQGVAVGGDFGGSVSISLESAPAHRRGFFASFVQMGAPAGATLAAIVMALFGYMDNDAFLSWGWRIPFLLGGALALVGLRVRLRMAESPLFTALQEEAQARRQEAAPIVRVLRERWLALVIAILGTMAPLALQGLMPSYVLKLATDTGGHSHSAALWAYSLGSVVQIVVCSVAGRISDRVGRTRVMLAGIVVGLVLSYPVLWAVSQPSGALMFLGMFVGLVTVGIMYGPMAAFISERFGTTERYTGSSLGYQISTTLGSGLGPLIAATLAAAGGFHLVAVYLIVCFAIGGAVISAAARRRVV